MEQIIAKPLKYLVLDIETEGLNPNKHGILEIGAIAVDDALTTLGEFRSTVFGITKRENLDPFIQNMHGVNGLLNEIAVDFANHVKCGGPSKSEANVDSALARWILQQGYPAGQVVLVGNSVHFDQTFLKARFPETAALLHYRIKDIGALRRELEECGYLFPEGEDLPHRGLEDARIELAEWRFVRALVGRASSWRSSGGFAIQKY